MIVEIGRCSVGGIVFTVVFFKFEYGQIDTDIQINGGARAISSAPDETIHCNRKIQKASAYAANEQAITSRYRYDSENNHT
jgi:hypothetical protein